MSTSPMNVLQMSSEDMQLLLKTYLTPSGVKEFDDELADYPLDQLIDEIQAGKLPNEYLATVSIDPNSPQFNQVRNFFSAIALLDPSDNFVNDAQKSQSNENNTFDSSSVSKVVPQLLGSTRGEGKKEDKIKCPFTQIIKWDFNNPTNPILEKADCVLSSCIMNFMCLDLPSLCTYIAKLAAMIKRNGCLMMVGMFNAKYFTLGNQKFPMLNFNESFINRAMSDACLNIQTLKTRQSKISKDIIDYECTWFIKAIKESKK